MVKKRECSESSDDEQSYSSSSEEWSKSSDDVDEIVKINGFQVLDSQVIKHDIIQKYNSCINIRV